jgi:hypothetical protein
MVLGQVTAAVAQDGGLGLRPLFSARSRRYERTKTVGLIDSMRTILKHCTLGTLLSLLLLCSCATDASLRSRLPADVTFNKDAGRGGLTIVTLRLESGQKLPFGVDTGASSTCFDKSLEPQLGKPLGTTTVDRWGVPEKTCAYAAPTLYLGSTPLMTGSHIITLDLKHLSSPSSCPILGILGIDCLRNYCIQLDFAADKMRFLDDNSSNKEGWGKAFSLSNLRGGCFYVQENLVGVNGSGPTPGYPFCSLIDTGCNHDGWLNPQLFQQWTNHVNVPASGVVHSPKGVLGIETYPDLHLRGLELEGNGIGIHFLSRHLVTLDFPKGTMYLKRTSIGPLVDEDREAAKKAEGKSALKFLKGLKKKGQLPGWSRDEDVATAVLQFYTHYPDLVTFDNLMKQGDSFIYHYTVSRASKSGPWKLQKAWRTDHIGHTVEEYPVP